MSTQTEMTANETLRWELFDLSNDLKMLKQLLREEEVGFPTPPDENVPVDLIIETAEEHLRYLAISLGLDHECPAPNREHLADCYPLGEGRMTEEEYKNRKARVCGTGKGTSTGEKQ